MPSETADSNIMPIEELLEKFSIGSLRQRRRFINPIEERSSELTKLGDTLLESFDKEGDNWSAGWILQVLQRHQKEFLSEILNKNSLGWFKAPSGKGIDYGPLQLSLLEERFEDADRITTSSLRELAGPNALERGYVYFSEVESIDGIDLTTLDRLWIAYSQGRFGFSAQARLLDSFDGRYEMLWPRIGWKTDGVWTRYPKSFNWSLEAPEGHMPLVNQLRGVRLMDAYLNHPAIKSRCNEK
ncbi:GUN4 domain-containing protein [Prochlorococcus marinus]|uniref:GUN4 domain-containing protein n=1 Tax=Prochlorococcus marinus TaxID=1219 RepID=UPI0022B3AF9E|nr:GUN4 domain-containing protein [Prochlorococcus marinus]